MNADSAESKRHAIELALLEAVPEEVDAGADLILTVR